jgi:hypothetical protein
MAASLLERNKHNRPMDDPHARRISQKIRDGKWRYNGDTIKIDADGNVLDGQHRLWAIWDSGCEVESVIVYGIERDAFATIDTDRKLRQGKDIILLNGGARYRNIIASALTWLIRLQRGNVVNYRLPQHKITNADIEDAYQAHPEIGSAVENAMKLRSLTNPSLVAPLYYMVANRDPELAERMISILEDPEGIAVSHPFFRLRGYYTGDHHKKKDPVVTLANTIKAINAAAKGERIGMLNWKGHGKKSEKFPELNV